MKKNTTKPTMSPAPATKSVAAKPAAKKKTAAAPKKKAVAAVPSEPKAAPAPAAPKTAAVSVVAAAPTPAPKPVAAPAPVAVQPSPRKAVVTTISARVNVGFGNALYIRGEGAGLSWDAGTLMECVSDDLWRITLGESARGFTFKVLVNDLTWNVGPDCTVASGSSVTITPEF